MSGLKDMKFQEVVDIAKQEILLEMIKGNYDSAVRRMMELSTRWALENNND